MVLSPRFEDALNHDLYGKSRLPLFIMEKHMLHHYPLHHHNFAELSLVVDGTGTEILNGTPHRFKRGTVSLLLPHHIHEIRLDNPPVHKYNCMFDIHLLFLSSSDQEFGNYLLQTGRQLPSHYDLNEEQTVYMIDWFESMKLEYESTRFAKETSLRSKLLEALVFLTRTLYDSSEPGASTVQSQSNVLELLDYMHLHYNEELSLTNLADHYNWNASYVSRLFKQQVGQTFIHYLHSLRVGRAASLLATTDMDIVDISVEVGFDHARTLRRAFKKLKGMTPKQYRDKVRSGQG
ncbi:helix-turn-helix domain-containing protein [Paenibacillus hemerocallicola]|jgi:AraC-like DNA-binding protein|uniref:Helix-turn-helix domain-containing protein n=1 Tax=Paenibacillus hemerocallicola TaxID=1172614 RepID=A0A5C4T5X1_9BACL|nr:AraC family transcriptional regulator [Paenibacillus hemerocallicola]TNJ64175.1 helix-turn-helix domain-containing protein [Paenibacillus hemerocallicola]